MFAMLALACGGAPVTTAPLPPGTTPPTADTYALPACYEASVDGWCEAEGQPFRSTGEGCPDVNASRVWNAGEGGGRQWRRCLSGDAGDEVQLWSGFDGSEWRFAKAGTLLSVCAWIDTIQCDYDLTRCFGSSPRCREWCVVRFDATHEQPADPACPDTKAP